MEEIICCNSITKYDDLFGFETLDPMVNVVECNEPEKLGKYTLEWGFFAIYLKDVANCTIDYGRTKYDHGNQTIIAFAPGQTSEFENVPGILPNFFAVLFHPDYLLGTSLAEKMRLYNFFSYDSNEALHLTDDERETIYHCIKSIRNELRTKDGDYSKDIIISQIELICNYCRQYYARQFGTRHELSTNLMAQFEQNLNRYLSSGNASRNGLPNVSYFADKAHLSPKYFGDLVKIHTGITAQEFIRQHLTTEAKNRLLDGHSTVNEVAYSLGFQYPQHFVRFFKRNVGCTPKAFQK